MKFRLTLIAVLAASLFAQTMPWKPEPENPSPATVPKWLLIHRYWGSVNTSTTGGIYSPSPGWVMLTETFDTADQLKARLDSLVRHSGLREQNVVGLWQLSDLTRIPIRITQTVKLIPERIEERKEIERTWSIEKQ